MAEAQVESKDLKDKEGADNEKKKNLLDIIVGRSVKTRILHQINGGAFGAIFLGRLMADEEEVAVKLERQKCYHPQLLFEGNVLRHLDGGPGIPKVHWFGVYEPDYNVLVLDLLGPSLQDLFSYCDHKFSIKTTLLLMDQMIDIVEYVHDQHFLHRDIKPDNFMIGRGENASKVYIIDFGLAKKYQGHRRRSLSSYHVARPLVGTARYCSVHAHLGHEEAFRDDVEALGYVMVYFLKGTLPWQGLHAANVKEKFNKIKEVKISLPLKNLCEDLPPEFGTYINYCRMLKMDDTPEYGQIKELFRNLAQKMDIQYDNRYDWVVKAEETGVQPTSLGISNQGHDSASEHDSG